MFLRHLQANPERMNPLPHTSIQRKSSADVLVIGAGVFGLWAARQAVKAGKSVLVLEKRRVGAGASGGVVGALMPHMPDRWNAKKQAQFEALVSLEQAVVELVGDTGLTCGYRRCGRLMPLTHERMLAVLEERMEGVRDHWQGFSMQHVEVSQMDGNWLSRDVAAFGAQWDSLSARIDPRRYVAALAAFVRTCGEIREGVEVVALADRAVLLADGVRIDAGEVIVANGFEAYPLLQPHLGVMTNGAPVGRGVKGQATLLGFAHADDLPILYHDGAYAVPHAGNRVAVGSSSHDIWTGEPDTVDPADEAFHAKAIRLAPALSEALVLERWAGARPRNMLKAHDTEPWCGPVLGLEGASARIGGFKTGLAWAHVDLASFKSG